jgi:NADPH:quinone reductase-like Zn-dependent oxidoreductase
MQALLIRDFGPAEKILELADIPQPVSGPEEVLLRFLAAPVNPADLNWIEGTYGTRPELPETPGTEGVAEVVESRIAGFSVGQKVICLDHAHAWQQFRCAKADKLLAVPDGIDPLQLAMLKVNPATAALLLSEFADLPREDILRCGELFGQVHPFLEGAVGVGSDFAAVDFKRVVARRQIVDPQQLLVESLDEGNEI